MMKVRTIVRPSPIHGMGVFAEEAIPVGTIAWRFDPVIDKVIDREHATELMMDRGYVSKRNPRGLVVCGDNAQFINFQNGIAANLVEVLRDGESDLVACRPINRGEELTVDRSTDADYERKMREPL